MRRVEKLAQRRTPRCVTLPRGLRGPSTRGIAQPDSQPLTIRLLLMPEGREETVMSGRRIVAAASDFAVMGDSLS